jgi:hypothetical protein
LEGALARSLFICRQLRLKTFLIRILRLKDA